MERWARTSHRGPDLPRRHKARLIALHYFRLAFRSNQTYTEYQVDSAIKSGNLFDTDHVQIRRYLVDYGMMDRSQDGKIYVVSSAYLSLADWDPKFWRAMSPTELAALARRRIAAQH